MNGQLTPHDRVMALQQVAPAAIPELRRRRGRPDDVGEEDRRERPFGLAGAPAAGEELLHLVEQRVPIYDDPGEGAESPKKAGHRRALPEQLDVGDEARHEDQVELAFAVHLVGDADPVGVRVVSRRIAVHVPLIVGWRAPASNLGGPGR